MGMFIAESFFMRYLSFNSIDYLNFINMFAITILGISFVFFWFLSKDAIEDDIGNRVNGFRVLASQILYSTALLLLLFLGEISINNLVIYLAAIAGVMIYFIGSKLNSNCYFSF